MVLSTARRWVPSGSARLTALGGQVLVAAPSPSMVWIAEHPDEVASYTGITPFGETLRVALDLPWEPPHGSIPVELPVSGLTVTCTPCEIDQIKCFIVRTDDGDHSRTVVEIVAPVDLRHVLALQDGDSI